MGKYGKDGAGSEARHARAHVDCDVNWRSEPSLLASIHHYAAEEREGRDEPSALDVAVIAPQREAVIQPGPAPAGEQRRVFVGAPHRDVIATPAARARIHAEVVQSKSDRQPVIAFAFQTKYGVSSCNENMQIVT